MGQPVNLIEILKLHFSYPFRGVAISLAMPVGASQIHS